MEAKGIIMRNFSLLLLIVLMTACGESEKKPDKLQRIGWINGFWKMTSKDGSMTESWAPETDSSLAGVGKFMDTAGKVLTTEEIRIVLRKGTLRYVPVVSNQNLGMPVTFDEISFSDTMVIFENKGHDFPQRIAYIKKSDNSMLAYIEGKVDGVVQRMEFPYERQ